MLKPVLDVVIPALVVLMMMVAGLGLTVEDFRRVGRRPWLVAWTTCGHAILLPCAAFALTQLLGVKPYIGEGMLLVAACPAGSMASFYTLLARANVALAVSLIAVSCLAALVVMPAWLAVFEVCLGGAGAYPVPAAVIVQQLVVLLILPILAGMTVRRLWSAAVLRHQGRLLGVGVGGLAVLVAFVLAQEWEHITTDLPEIGRATVALTALAALAGYGMGWAGGAELADRFSVGAVFVVRNGAVAMAIAVTALGRLEFAVFATAYFLAQTPLLLAAVFLFRRGAATACELDKTEQPNDEPDIRADGHAASP